MRRVYLLLAVLVLALSSFAYAYVGDGVCDDSDLLKHSPDCSAAVYVLTPSGGPLESVRIYRSSSGSALVPVLLKNYDPQRDAYVCFSADGSIQLFDNSGEVKSLCFTVPASGQTSATLGIRYDPSTPSDTRVGRIIIASSYSTRSVDVYVTDQSPVDVLSDSNIAVAVAIALFAFTVLIVRWLKSA